jgi:pimeloyl-ACP methyl ester carboxylesterase
MPQVLSATDKTSIAFERFGHGAPLILIVGAFNTRATGVPLAQALAPHFSVYTYDRRGRGDSGDGPRYAIAREVDDLAALIAEAGGTAAVFGYSSGAMLALEAAASGLAISRLVLYDAPYAVGDWQRPDPVDHAAQLAALIEAGRRGEAVEYFQRHLVGMPEEVIVQLRQAPFRPALEALAHTLVYDATLIGDRTLPAALVSRVRIPTLVMAGGASPFMRAAAEALAAALPAGQAHIFDGQGHDIEPAVVGPVVATFLAG